MNLYQAVGVNNYNKDVNTGEDVSFNEVYDRLVSFIGLKELIDCIPQSRQQLKEAYEKDKNFNSIPLSNWDRWTGFEFWGAKRIDLDSPLKRLLKDKGITSYSASQLVSLLKHAALKYIGR